MISKQVEEAVVLRFRAQWLADQTKGRDVPVSDYLERFPKDQWALVAKEYLQLTEDAVDADEGRDPEPGASGHFGPYRLERALGRGGQGTVYLAEDTRSNRKVALKVLTAHQTSSSDALMRFRREAEVASKLDHDGICRVFDAGSENGVPFIAMQLVDGKTLQWHVAQTRNSIGKNGSSHLALETARGHDPQHGADLEPLLRIFEKTARALHAAHEAGIIHRDIKPGNIMITDQNEPVILDFGLAYDGGEGARLPLTQTGDIFGTPAYMSPEQIRGQRIKVDARSDVYSLGATLYECLTLKPPFDAPTREALYQAVLSKEPPDPCRLNRALPDDLKVVLACALEKDRGRRYRSASALADDLAAVRESRPIAARPIGAVGRTLRWARRRPMAAALAITLIIGVPSITAMAGYIWANLPDIEAQRQARIEKEVETAVELGLYELHHGRAERAVEHFEHALDERVLVAEAAAGLAYAHLKMKQAPAALDAIERAELRLEEPMVLARVKADVLGALGRVKDAKRSAAQAPTAESALSWFLEGMRALRRGESLGEDTKKGRAAFERAESLLRRAVGASSTARRAYHFQLAHAVGHRGKDATAQDVADTLKALWPRSAQAWFWIGYATHRANLEEAQRAYTEATRLNEGFVVAHGNRANALWGLGRHDEAERAYRRAIQLDPEWISAHYNLGKLLRTTGRPDDAIPFYRKTIAICEALAARKVNGRHWKRFYAKAHFDLGLIFRSEHGDLDAAIEVLRKAVKTDPRMARAHNQLGQAFQAKREFKKAEAAYRDAVAIWPDDAMLHHNLGTSLQDQHRLDDAIVEYRKAILLDKEHARSHGSLASALNKQGKLEESATHYRRAYEIQKRRGSEKTHLTSMKLYMAVHQWTSGLRKDGQLDRAILILQEYATAFPEIGTFSRTLRRLKKDG